MKPKPTVKDYIRYVLSNDVRNFDAWKNDRPAQASKALKPKPKR